MSEDATNDLVPVDSSIESNTDVTGFEHTGDRQEVLRDHIKDAAREHGWDGPSETEQHREVERSRRERTRSERPVRRPRRQPQRDVAQEDAAYFRQTEAAPQSSGYQAPAGWQGDWDSVPAHAQAQIAQFVHDVANVVNHYKEIDQAFQPYDQTIASFGKTRGEAIAQLFSWFQALAENPHQAWPALIQSYKYDWRNIVEAFRPGSIAEFEWMKGALRRLCGDQVYQRAWNEIAAAWRNNRSKQVNFSNSIDQLVEQRTQERLAPYYQQQQYQQQQQAAYVQHQTNQYLNSWASDKPYFEYVRYRMGELLTPDAYGNAAVPLKNGLVDLDSAYVAACRENPLIMFHYNQEQAANVRRARNAGSSLNPNAYGAPGRSNRRNTNDLRPTGESVRATIMNAWKDAISR